MPAPRVNTQCHIISIHSRYPICKEFNETFPSKYLTPWLARESLDKLGRVYCVIAWTHLYKDLIGSSVKVRLGCGWEGGGGVKDDINIYIYIYIYI